MRYVRLFVVSKRRGEKSYDWLILHRCKSLQPLPRLVRNHFGLVLLIFPLGLGFVQEPLPRFGLGDAGLVLGGINIFDIIISDAIAYVVEQQLNIARSQIITRPH